MSLVETIPIGLSFNTSIVDRSIHEEWLDLINSAKDYIEIASPFWNLNSSDSEPGRQIFEALADAGHRKVKIYITQDVSRGVSDNADSAWLQDQDLAMVRTLDFVWLVGGGFFNSKFIIVDGKHMYLGSAGMDWKALSESKELGIVIRDCPCVAGDLEMNFRVYWKMGEKDSKVGDPYEYDRVPFDEWKPNTVMLNGAWSNLYFSSSSYKLMPQDRTLDFMSVMKLFSAAKQTICISVKDFIPVMAISDRAHWPPLDNFIRHAAYRGVNVKMLVSKGERSLKEEKFYLESLAKINPAVKGSIEIKWFTIPATAEQQKIGPARVSRSNYMVTENASYIGTASWVGDEFDKSGNVGIVVSSKDSQSVQEQLQAVFDRDWNSEYATPLV